MDQTGRQLQYFAVFPHQIGDLKSLVGVENDFTGFRVRTSDDHETIESGTDAD